MMFAAAVTAGAAMLTMLTPTGNSGSSEMKRFLASSHEGNGEAQYRLGLSYLNGEGVVKNYIDAYKWVLLSGTADRERADITGKIIAKKMTPEQVEEAIALAKLWQRKFDQTHPAMK